MTSADFRRTQGSRKKNPAAMKKIVDSRSKICESFFTALGGGRRRQPCRRRARRTPTRSPGARQARIVSSRADPLPRRIPISAGQPFYFNPRARVGATCPTSPYAGLSGRQGRSSPHPRLFQSMRPHGARRVLFHIPMRGENWGARSFLTLSASCGAMSSVDMMATRLGPTAQTSPPKVSSASHSGSMWSLDAEMV